MAQSNNPKRKLYDSDEESRPSQAFSQSQYVFDTISQGEKVIGKFR